MPALVRPVTDERDALLAYLAQQRFQLESTAYGLTDEQARLAPTVSTLTVGGLVKHSAQVEYHWINIVLQQPEDLDYEDGFVLREDETLAGVIDEYHRIAKRTEDVVASIDDLGQAVPVPKGVPWFPDDVDAWSVRWVLHHLITETSRHGGHADIVREHIDGATFYALIAGVEGWPATPWLQPWQPPAR
jgi:hypothetical protein